jgi:hypothetical protein
MANERILRSRFYLLAGALVTTFVVLTSPAADARSHHNHGAHSSHFARHGVSSPVMDHGAVNGMRKAQDYSAAKTGSSSDKADNGAPALQGTTAGKGAKQRAGGKETGAGAPLQDANVPELHARDLGPIDTRITVQPRLHGPGAVRQAKSRIGLLGSRYSPVRHSITRGQTGRVARNAIGLPITSPSGIHSPTGAAPRVVPNAGGNLAKPNPGSDYSGVFHPGSVATGTGVGRSSINGNGFARRGFVPAALGGPSKYVVIGINGSTIRPKH